jgi:hypothetical protein
MRLQNNSQKDLRQPVEIVKLNPDASLDARFKMMNIQKSELTPCRLPTGFTAPPGEVFTGVHRRHGVC